MEPVLTSQTREPPHRPRLQLPPQHGLGVKGWLHNGAGGQTPLEALTAESLCAPPPLTHWSVHRTEGRD